MAKDHKSPAALDDDRRRPLLERRVPRDQIEIGCAYVVHARNGGVGVAVEHDGRIGYQIHREKFGTHFLFVEWDWDEGPPYGTAIPLRRLDAVPPGEKDGLLEWLATRESEWRDEIDDAWRVVLARSWRARG